MTITTKFPLKILYASILFITIFSAANITIAQIHDSTSAYPTFKGLSMTGYQGWFSTPGDGARNDWTHYRGSNSFQPGSASIEYWPDMRETDPDERYITDFVYADGTPAYVFSSAHPKTVNRHFQWMKEYGIDGAFVQRFSSSIPIRRSTDNVVLRNVFAAAKEHNRAFAIMYDVSGRSVKVDGVINDEKRRDEVNRILNDWEDLVVNLELTSGGNNQPYLYHNGKPLVVIWGAGFKNRDYDIQYFVDLVDSLKNNPVYGGCSIMLGVPTYWRSGDRDCISGSEWNKLIELIKTIDIVEPWHTSRFNRGALAIDFENRVQDDIVWCTKHGIDYVPTVSPGIREKILHNNNFEISREGGYYFWEMAKAALEAGSEMLYLGMYDEVDEGTQYHKINNHPPISGYASPRIFATYGDEPEDHYLWLAGEATRALRGEFTMGSKFRDRANDSDFQSGIIFAEDGSSYEMQLVNPPAGRKIYYTDPYKVPDGAPTLGVPRNAELFGNELTSSTVNFTEDQRGLYIRFVEVDEATDEVLAYKAIVGAHGYASVPFSTSFEDGNLDHKFWTTNDDNNGIVYVSSEYDPKIGDYHLLMASNLFGIYSTNSADIHINLSKLSKDVILKLDYKTFSTKNDSADGIYCSDDAGISYRKIYDLEATLDYKELKINLTDIIDSTELNFTENFIIRFQHKDGAPIPHDGIAFDNIKILYSDVKSGFGQFIESDENTQGEWIGKYGIDGYNIIGEVSDMPEYASVYWDPNSKTIVWNKNSTDKRGLQTNADSTTLAARYAETDNHPWWFTIDVGAIEKQVSIYFLDGDNQNRKFILNLIDKSKGDKYDTQTIQDFSNGKWYTWKIKGKVKFVLDLLEGPSAVISGLFFAPSPPSQIEVYNFLTFDGNNDFVDCGRDSSLQVSGSNITLESWFKINSAKPATYQSTILAMDHNETGNDVGYFLRANGNGQINWGFGDGTWHEIKSEEGVQLFELETWNHVAGVLGNNRQQIFLNGNLILNKDSVYSEILPTTSEHLLIGSAASTDNRVIDASLSEVRIWNVARTRSEIKEFSTKRLTGLENGLVAYYPMNESEGQIIYDMSTNANNGILGGSTDDNEYDPLWTEGVPITKMVDILEDYNGSFEEGLNFWRFFEVPNSLGSKVEIINGDVIHGANAAKITFVEADESLVDRGFDNWDSNMNLEPGANYFGEFWAKAESLDSGKLAVTYGYFDKDRNVISSGGQKYTLDTTYKKYNFTFIPPEQTAKGWIAFRWKHETDNIHLPGIFYLDNVQLYTEDKTVDIEDKTNQLPDKFTLTQNYPNPFNPTTTIQYSIPNVASGFTLSKVQINIYDLLGRKVVELVNENQSAGNYEVKFNASDLTSGIYFYTIRSGNFVQTKKMLLMK